VKLILKIAAGVILAVIALVVAISAMAGHAVDQATKKQTWVVKVQAPAGYHWSGSFGSRTVDGVGSKKVTTRDIAITAADAQKQDGGHWPLRLTLTKGGKILDSQVTRAEYGLVTVEGSNF
jgi:hypothetical protein